MTDTTSAVHGLWLDTAPTSAYPSLTDSIHADVAVLGGGIAGLTAALLLARRGVRVAVLEAARVGSGVTGCTTAKVSALQSTIYTTITSRHSVATAQTYAEASLAGVDCVAAIVEQEGIQCDLVRRPAFTYALDESERGAVERELEAAARAGLPVEFVATPAVPYPAHGATCLRDQLQLHPVRYVQGLAKAVVAAGSDVFEGSRALGVSEGSPCVVRTPGGSVRADHVIVATHYPSLDRGLYFARLKAERSYCVAARLRSGSAPEAMAISAGSNSRSVRSYGDYLIVGGEGHSTGSRQATPERFERLEAFAREHWDVAAVTHRWSAHDPVPYDHLPMVGPYRPGASQLWVSTGFMKWGLSSATFAAEILADAITGRANPWAETFTPQRLSLRSTHEVAELGAKFGADFVADRARPPQSLRTGSIPPGEARVLPDRWGLGRKGVYRDEEGGLHAVSLRCTHLGCLLRFNAAERSWDCPCHGSRFDVDGGVLEGPAVQPLERRDP